MQHPSLEHERLRDTKAAAAAWAVRACTGVSLAGLLVVYAASAAARSRVLDSVAALSVAFATGWIIAAVGAAAAAFIAARRWSLLPRFTAVLGFVPWAVICLVATIVLRGFLA